MTKECNKCGIQKPLTAFSKNKSDSSGYFRWCRECWNAARRKRYAKNPEPFKLAGERYRNKKELMLSECFWCHKPAVKLSAIIPGTSRLVPTCNGCSYDATIFGRLNNDKTIEILSSLNEDDLNKIRHILIGEALNVKSAIDAMNLYDKHKKERKVTK